MSNPTITFIPQRRFYGTAAVAETHRRLLAEGHRKFPMCSRTASSWGFSRTTTRRFPNMLPM